jgi:hypothetical protein
VQPPLLIDVQQPINVYTVSKVREKDNIVTVGYETIVYYGGLIKPIESNKENLILALECGIGTRIRYYTSITHKSNMCRRTVYMVLGRMEQVEQ